MNSMESILSRRESAVISTNKVLRSTYMLLSLTLLFSAAMAGLSMLVSVSPMVSMGTSLGALALIWLVLPRTENSAAGIAVVFAIAGLLGFGLGPILQMYLALPNGGQVIATALGGTGVVFLGLSGYALTSRRDFSFMGGFLFVGLIVVLVAMVANLFLEIPALSLALSAAIVLLMSGLILFDTSRIINGGETNYIRATVALYLDIYNLFIALLQLLGAFSSDD
ncbi:Bax inhibitor-1/YccA family protein [Thiohalobacter sp. IOR34]|uniref:Bax inhibitor-1/YccA family protein n=1 Tax=Thiohalobacter sp. IOR34 TaxID=3057176 RepID=UPI0025AFBE10|nr:Bax inhibitor-1/YccA family protein [Thiohalobacter sp. IOR34]WJW74325.1 Bax inhibitor-1/YccA family protein [Thiohalobacter sp. IOR34]